MSKTLLSMKVREVFPKPPPGSPNLTPTREGRMLVPTLSGGREDARSTGWKARGLLCSSGQGWC